MLWVHRREDTGVWREAYKKRWQPLDALRCDPGELEVGGHSKQREEGVVQ